MRGSMHFEIEAFRQDIIKRVNQEMLAKNFTLEKICEAIEEPIEKVKQQFSFDGTLDVRILGKVLKFMDNSSMNPLVYNVYPWIDVSKVQFELSDNDIESGVSRLE